MRSVRVKQSSLLLSPRWSNTVSPVSSSFWRTSWLAKAHPSEERCEHHHSEVVGAFCGGSDQFRDLVGFDDHHPPLRLRLRLPLVYPRLPHPVEGHLVLVDGCLEHRAEHRQHALDRVL